MLPCVYARTCLRCSCRRDYNPVSPPSLLGDITSLVCVFSLPFSYHFTAFFLAIFADVHPQLPLQGAAHVAGVRIGTAFVHSFTWNSRTAPPRSRHNPPSGYGGESGGSLPVYQRGKVRGNFGIICPVDLLDRPYEYFAVSTASIHIRERHLRRTRSAVFSGGKDVE